MNVSNDMLAITSLFDQHLSAGACDELFDRLYPAIKALARQELLKLNPGQHMTPTVLVNECYLKFKLQGHYSFENQQHFYHTAARCMRFFLIDNLRHHQRMKRQGQETAFQHSQVQGDKDIALDMMLLDDALQQLEVIDPALAELTSLKFFSGMTFAEMAEIYDCSTSQVHKRWQVARALLMNLIEDNTTS